jgi:hypothetical protein
MHKIIVENQCGCFRRSELESGISMASKDDALSKAIQMKNHMNEKFCKKHEFQLIEDSENFIISFRPQQPSSCCGTGCCS